MNIKQITVHGLFNTFHHEIKFSSENIRIIIGENGVGKEIYFWKIGDEYIVDIDVQHRIKGKHEKCAVMLWVADIKI